MAVILQSCRACAQHLDQNEIENAEGFFQRKKSDYSELTTLKVQNNDGLPRLLCYKCYLMLGQFGDFKQTCIQSVDLLKNMVVLKVEVDSNASWDEKPADESDYSVDNIDQKPIDVNRAVGAEVKSTATVKRPIRTKTPNKRYSKELVKNEPKVNGNPSSGQKMKKPDTPKPRVTKIKTCPLCEKEFANFRCLKRHLQEVHSTNETPSFKCTECYKLFHTQTALKTHQKCHIGQKFICEQCGRSFSTKVRITTHMHSHSTGHEVPCPMCDRTFESRSQMYSHKFKKHSAAFNAPATCLICNTTFGNQKKMQNHRSLVHTVYTGDSDRVLQCPYCVMKLKTNAILRKHIQLVHTGERNYPCPDCEKRFKTPAALKKHSYFHSGERPVRCAVCDKGFYQKGALNIHMNVHKKQWIAEGVQGIELYKYRNNTKSEK